MSFWRKKGVGTILLWAVPSIGLGLLVKASISEGGTLYGLMAAGFPIALYSVITHWDTDQAKRFQILIDETTGRLQIRESDLVDFQNEILWKANKTTFITAIIAVSLYILFIFIAALKPQFLIQPLYQTALFFGPHLPHLLGFEQCFAVVEGGAHDPMHTSMFVAAPLYFIIGLASIRGEYGERQKALDLQTLKIIKRRLQRKSKIKFVIFNKSRLLGFFICWGIAVGSIALAPFSEYCPMPM